MQTLIIKSRLASKITIPYLPLSFRSSKIQRGKEIIPKGLQISKYYLLREILLGHFSRQG